MSDSSQAGGHAEYRVLARKYRPQTFDDLLGQDALVRTLKNALATGRLAHAFVLTGVRGVGKTTTARIIARALNCTGPAGTGAGPHAGDEEARRFAWNLATAARLHSVAMWILVALIVATAALDLVSDGVLTTWLLDSSTGRQLGLASNGRASRGTAGPPAPSTTNLYLAPGTATPDELMADIAEGLYVTELIGMGVNGVTGDYSRGAAGFWIERGRRAHPVSEITIAGNLKDMFRNLTPADDLEFRHGTNAPTVRIDGMTVAGN